MGAVTDNFNKVCFDEVNQPGISNLIDLYMSVTGKSRSDIEKEFEGKNYGEFKRCIADKVCSVYKEVYAKSPDKYIVELNLYNFTARPHTPTQWCAVNSVENIDNKLV